MTRPVSPALPASIDELKRAAAHHAADQVASGMVVGLGSGSTSRFATLRIAERLRSGSLSDIVAIPTSEDTARLARQEGIPLTTLEERSAIDLTIDGADEVDDHLNVIKGLGGCLLREKIVAFASRHEIIIVDQRKLVSRLGTKAPVPVEVIRFGWKQTQAALALTGARPQLRRANDVITMTDEGNYIIDCYYPDGIAEPKTLEQSLHAIPGVVETGLFLDMVQTVVIATPDGVQIKAR